VKDSAQEKEAVAEQGEWKPSMNLKELILCIPMFIETVLKEQHAPVKKGEVPHMIGKFYLGLNYDYQQIWM